METDEKDASNDSFEASLEYLMKYQASIKQGKTTSEVEPLAKQARKVLKPLTGDTERRSEEDLVAFGKQLTDILRTLLPLLSVYISKHSSKQVQHTFFYLCTLTDKLLLYTDAWIWIVSH